MSVLTAPPRRHHIAPLALKNKAVQVTGIVGALLEGVAFIVVALVDDAAVITRRLCGTDDLWLFGLNRLRLDRNNRLWLLFFSKTDGDEKVSPPVSKELLAWGFRLTSINEVLLRCVAVLGRTNNGQQSYKYKLLHCSLFLFFDLLKICISAKRLNTLSHL